MGSHLDTQPTSQLKYVIVYALAYVVPGGRYDGILGIMAGLEALRVLPENKIRTKYPIALVIWTHPQSHPRIANKACNIYFVYCTRYSNPAMLQEMRTLLSYCTRDKIT